MSQETEKLKPEEVFEWISQRPVLQVRYSVAATRLECLVPASAVTLENGLLIRRELAGLSVFFQIPREARFWKIGDDLAIVNDETGEALSLSRGPL